MKKHSRLIELLMSYKALKTRVELIEIELEYSQQAIDYSRPIIRGGKSYDATYQAVEKRIDSDLAREKVDKERVIELIETGLKVLDNELELPLIKAKYLDGKFERDNMIYNSNLFPYSASQYYRVKKRALEKLEGSIGDLL